MTQNRGTKATRRKAFGVVLAMLVLLSYFSPAQATLRELPGEMYLAEGQSPALPAPLQWSAGESQAAASSQDERLAEGGESTAQMTVSLMGVVPLKRVAVNVQSEKRLIPGGMAIGVAMRTEGVLVVGTGEIAGTGSPAAQCGLRPGDVLVRVDGVRVESAKQLTGLMADYGGKEVAVQYLRGGVLREATLRPVRDETTGETRIGAWVRDSTAGIGTLSFYDPETGRYAALGHAITDGDTGEVLSVSEGQILQADVVAVQRGMRGAPGELKGSFLRSQTVLGQIEGNTPLGVYGQLTERPQNALYPTGVPIGLRSGVHTGPATILSTVDGTGVQAFAVEITRVNPQNEPAPKSMVLHVTDERLLEKTGGIVQGMSGSPIIQDGRLIGAVTHVFVSDPTQGYGLYVDWMLEE